MFDSLEDDMRKVDDAAPETGRQRMTRMLGFAGAIAAATLIIMGLLYAGIRFLD